MSKGRSKQESLTLHAIYRDMFLGWIAPHVNIYGIILNLGISYIV